MPPTEPTLRYITAAALADAAIVVLKRDDWIDDDPASLEEFVNAIHDRCPGPAFPILLLADDPAADVTLAVGDEHEARLLVDHLTERFGL